MTIVSYHEEIRSALFLSSVTLGTFIFTMKTFIIQTMKKEVYDNDRYQKKKKNIDEIGFTNSNYEPLKRLTWLLKWSIWLSLLSALSQITIGFSENTILSVICLILAASAWAIVGISVYFVSDNLSKMITNAEEELEEKNQKEAKEKNSETDK